MFHNRAANLGFQVFSDHFYNFRAFINKSCPYFHQLRAGIELFVCIGSSKNSTTRNDGYPACGFLVNVLHDLCRTICEWLTAQSTSTDSLEFGIWCLELISADGCVCCYKSVKT